MNLFSFQKISTATCAVILSASLGVSSAYAFGDTCNSLLQQTQENTRKALKKQPILNTKVFMGEQSCLKGYNQLSASELYEGGCYAQGSPFVTCVQSVPSWTAIQSSSDRHCLGIWKSVALNSRGQDFQYSPGLTFFQMGAQYAYHLSRNSLYMNTLDGLDQAEMQKTASRVTEVLK